MQRDIDTLYMDFIVSIVVTNETADFPNKKGKLVKKKLARITYASDKVVDVIAHGPEYKRAIQNRKHEQEHAANGVTLAHVVEHPKTAELTRCD